MSYTQPPAVATDVNFNRGNYAQPPAGFVDVDFAADVAVIVYSPVPGLIANVRASWNPEPAKKQSAIESLFQNAGERQIKRAANASQASATPSPVINAPHGSAQERAIAPSISWDDSAQSRERVLIVTSNNAETRDITNSSSPWANASVYLDPYLSSSFLVRTPWKDRRLSERYFSSAVFAPLFRVLENKPEPFGAQAPGVANLAFFDHKNRLNPSIYAIGSSWENNPIQPKDPALYFKHKNAPSKDLEAFDTPWGTGRPVDITRSVVYPDYDGPLDDNGPGPDENTIIIPTLRFYIVANSAQIIRVSDGRDVAASNVSLSINTDSHSWSMSATLAGRSAMALLEGTDAEPVEVDVIINGESWRVIIDGWNSSEAWRRETVTVRGRSRSAYLAAPYAPTRDYAEAGELTAAQLVEQELPPGWVLDWGLEDWIVDAGAWKYAGLAPIDAISRIVAASGGYIQSDQSTDTIIARPLYPAAPWNWINEVPDVQLPRAIISQRGSQKKPGQGVNGVYVHGMEPGGILAKVVRTGTAGEVLSQTIVDPLITDTTPARYRGLAAIAASARQAVESYEMPLSATYGGLILPGSMIASGEEYDGDFVTYWRGMVRGVTVTAGSTRASNGGTALSVKQRLEIERHFED